MNNTIFQELNSLTKDGKRVYTTPEGNVYPSITTILSATGDKSGLEEWKKRVGAEEAAKIVKEATTNGSAMHNILEAYCLHKDHNEHSNKMALQMAKFGVKFIDKHLTHVVQTEACLYSDRLKVAGRTDMVCFWKQKLGVLDYKNRGLKEFKTEKHCLSYKLQICFYSQAILERIGKAPKIGIILQLNAFGGKVYEFDPFEDKLCIELNNRIQQYHKGEQI